VEHVQDANLRETSWNQRFLETVAGDHNLKHREAVLYSNKKNDRYRLVARWHGLSVLILPPIDPAAKLTMHLMVSRFLRSFCSTDALLGNVREQIVMTQERIARRKAREAAMLRVKDNRKAKAGRR
jgi:hypothetical protein